ncbi:LPS assembly lipoprotein LptE [Candidatus Omnitrophota bacterium]
MRALNNLRFRFLGSCFLACCLSFLAFGCGYTTRSLITEDYQTIYVRPFVNKINITGETSVARRYQTYYPLLENDITRKVIDQFILDGNLRLAEEANADLILEGELVNYRRDALRYTGADEEEIEEYRISLVVTLRLYDASAQTVLWQVKNFTGDTTYFTANKSESQSINEAVSDLARRVVDRVIDIW